MQWIKDFILWLPLNWQLVQGLKEMVAVSEIRRIKKSLSNKNVRRLIANGTDPELSLFWTGFGKVLIHKMGDASEQNWQPNTIATAPIGRTPGFICRFLMEPSNISAQVLGGRITKKEIVPPDRIKNHLDAQFPDSPPQDGETPVITDDKEAIFEVASSKQK